MTSIDSRGIVSDTGGSLNVQNNVNVAGLTVVNQNSMAPNPLQASSSFAVVLGQGWTGCITNVPGSGFYQVPVTGAGGMGYFTASLPNPALFVGGDILITDTLGQFPYLLTGALAMNVSGTLLAGGQVQVSSSQGTKLTVSAGGTVGLWSDSKGWLVCAVSGSATLLAKGTLY